MSSRVNNAFPRILLFLCMNYMWYVSVLILIKFIQIHPAASNMIHHDGTGTLVKYMWCQIDSWKLLCLYGD